MITTLVNAALYIKLIITGQDLPSPDDRDLLGQWSGPSERIGTDNP